MGSYKWGHESPNMGISIVTLRITLLITAHEPPSRKDSCGWLSKFGSLLGSLL